MNPEALDLGATWATPRRMPWDLHAPLGGPGCSGRSPSRTDAAGHVVQGECPWV